MKFSSSFASLLALVSIAAALPAPDGRGERGIRLPLNRKSANVVGHVDLSALKAQLIHASK